jgi:hypothetical protein
MGENLTLEAPKKIRKGKRKDLCNEMAALDGFTDTSSAQRKKKATSDAGEVN